MKSQLTFRRVKLPCDYRLMLLILTLNFGCSSYRMRSVFSVVFLLLYYLGLQERHSRLKLW
jgi:hypothetical protein